MTDENLKEQISDLVRALATSESDIRDLRDQLHEATAMEIILRARITELEAT